MELVLAGDGPERKRLQDLAESLGIDRACRFLGNIDRSSVRDEMRKCDLFVLPSRKETFGVVLLEAMACGKPVISCLPAGSTLLRENLVESVDADDLDAIEAITRGFLGRSERARRLHAERAVAYARKHLSSEAALNRRIDF